MAGSMGARTGRDREAHERRTGQRARFDDIPAGATVSRIKPTKNDATRWTLRVGGKIVATLDRREIDRLGLCEGQAWTEELAGAVEEAGALDAALRFAKSSLARRPMSRRRLLERLGARGTPEAVAGRVADEMETLALIDDGAYALGLAREQIAKGPVGRRVIEEKLRRKGVGRAEAARAAEAALEGGDPMDAAVELARSRARRLPASLDLATRARRLTGLLARRGFEPDVVHEAVRAALEGSAPDDDAGLW